MNLVVSFLGLGISVLSLTVATVAYVRTGKWRYQDKQDETPAFKVTAVPILDLRPNVGDGCLYEVEVTVENTSKSDASINHAGIYCDAAVRILNETRPGGSFPLELGARGQIAWNIPGDEFFGSLASERVP